MFNFNKLIKQALLALTIAFSSGAVLADPVYQVTVDTASLAGTNALMDFSFLSLDDAVSATATLSNFSGAFGAEYERFGDVQGDLGGVMEMTNANGLNYLTQEVALGGIFTFDVSFSGDFLSMMGSDGAWLSVMLYDEFFSPLAAVIDFSLMPAFGNDPASVTPMYDSAMVSVNVVPEPSDLLLLLTGLAMLTLARRQTGASR